MTDWKQYEGQLAGGEFPLERHLGGGEGSAVFLTRFASGRAAIKLVPAGETEADELVARWNRAAAFQHPHLLRILAAGTWRAAGMPVAYLVMEYGEENLAEVLSQRALTAEEAREMLLPVADVLVYLHGRGVAHGDLKPSNILAVEDTVKVSSETAAAGDPAADLRALGVTLVQALTQQAPGGERAAVDGLPSPFRELARNCLQKDPGLRWPADKIAAWLRSPGQPAPPSAPLPVEHAAGKARPRYYVAVAGLAVVVAALVVGRVTHRPIAPEPPAAPPATATAPPEQAPAEREAPRGEQAGRDGVIRRVLPEIPAKARDTIHGRAKVVVRVAVDPSGNVKEARLEDGGSAYFGRLALEAARHWRFAPAEGGGSRNWTLRFEITQSATQVVAVRAGRE